MKALLVLGSKNVNGRTAQAAEAFNKGLMESGCETEKLFLSDLNIERCKPCGETGWGICRNEGWCIIEDDFAAVVTKIKAADATIFADPVYFTDLSETLKAFLDRLRRICRWNEIGKENIAGKPTVGICVAGGGGVGAPAATVALEKVLETCGFDIVDMIPVRRQNLEIKLKVLTETGKWLADSYPAS